jgi:FkbM family methyltransferase
MSHTPPASDSLETPAAGAQGPKPGGLPRRAFLLGGAAGALVGGTAGTAAGRALAPTPPTPPPEVIEKQLPLGTKLSYAQFGEDLIANSLFYMFNDNPKPTYLDIGAFEPIISNNTYFFYERGARGVLVEPTPVYADRLKVIRPEDTVLGVGIGVTDATEMDFHVLSEPQHNTFDKAHAEKFVREKGYKIERIIKIPLVNLNRVMAEHFGGAAPDYLSIDVEGIEFDIAKTIDFNRFRPKVICIETLIANTLQHNPEITKFMAEKGYEVRGMSYPNTLYLDKQLLKDKK